MILQPLSAEIISINHHDQLSSFFFLITKTIYILGEERQNGTWKMKLLPGGRVPVIFWYASLQPFYSPHKITAKTPLLHIPEHVPATPASP